jgi:hypothetical protein
MAKYTESKKKAKELYELVPYITPRIAFKFLQESDLPRDQIPSTHITLFRWFKEFGKISNKDRYDTLMNMWLKDNQILVVDDEIIRYQKGKRKK